ncbi:MAG: virulence RhuM family protein [Flavobacterium sp.]
MNTDEIVIYQDDELSSRIEVRLEDETVWLTQMQMADLFKATKQNVSLHINNIFREGELQQEAVVKEYLTTAADGKKYKTKIYNLDVIISVGYRVKSQRGTQFRIWANKILKEYLLKGYAVNYRLEVLEKKVNSIEMKNSEFELILNTGLGPNQGIFFDGQIFDAHSFVSKIIKSAKKSIVLLDNYIDESVLMLLSKRNKGVETRVYTKSVSG